MKQLFSGFLLAGLIAAIPADQAQAAVTQTVAAQIAAAPASADDVSIAAVVNGQVITNGDVAARARLLALSTGMAVTPDSLARLRPQISRELIDQTLQLQEINRRNIVVQESEIATAISHIEQGNNLPTGGLRGHMEAAGVPFSTLIAQIRTEVGWQDVLHQVLGPELKPTPGDINAEKKLLQGQIGQTQYHLAEIFIPVPDPADDATARNFADTVIKQLRAGAPFPVVAAQFSQSESALQGGDMGFLNTSQLDPATAAVVATMPAGAVSNPIRVPGGYDIVQLQETRRVGAQQRTMLNLREAFATFANPVGASGVSPDQIAIITKLMTAAHGAHSCDDIAAINAQFGNVHPADPGPVDLATVTPARFQGLLATMPLNQISQPLVAPDGVSVVMVCSRATAAQGLPSDDDINELIVQRRVDLESQQLLADLHHRSIVTQD